MEVKAKLRNLRIAPRKVQLLADLIRGKSVDQALKQLKIDRHRASLPLAKLIKSAVANADHNFHLNTSTLRIKTLCVDQGPMLKRFMPKAFGSAAEIQKRMSHIRVVLEGELAAGSAKAKPVEHKHKDGKHVDSADQEHVKPAKMLGNAKEAMMANKPKPMNARRAGKRAVVNRLNKDK